MGRALGLGERGEIDVTPQKRDEQGKWKRAVSGRSAERWRARCYYRGFDGVQRDLTRVARVKGDAVAALEAAFAERLNSVGDVPMTPTMSLVAAGEVWLAGIRRTDSGLAPRTVQDYGRTFARYVDKAGASLRGLTLTEANNPQRLRAFLQGVADHHGTGAAHATRSVLMGILSLAVNNGTLPTNALRQVGVVRSQAAKALRDGREPRDTTRAFTREQRAALIEHADKLATAENLLPQTARKRQAVADLAAFMAFTGVRITEARSVRWEDFDLWPADSEARPSVLIRGTKSKTSRRRLPLPPTLAARLRRRVERTGGTGYAFASPHLTDAERMWDQSNCAKALASLFADAGLSWAVPHTFRRTVATLLHEAGVPLVQIADQLGHADPAMTARVYLGRDLMGDRHAVAEALDG
ncbi:tyrosine-type recombinase/integrase [Blastococcus sp. SYSU DS1021]